MDHMFYTIYISKSEFENSAIFAEQSIATKVVWFKTD